MKINPEVIKHIEAALAQSKAERPKLCDAPAYRTDGFQWMESCQARAERLKRHLHLTTNAGSSSALNVLDADAAALGVELGAWQNFRDHPRTDDVFDDDLFISQKAVYTGALRVIADCLRIVELVVEKPKEGSGA